MLLNRGVIRVGLPHARQRRVRPGRRRRSLLVRERERAVAVPPPAADHQPLVPVGGHVGRPRDRRRRDHGAEPGAPGQRRDPRPRAGGGGADRRAAELDRRLRDRALHRADHRQRRRQPLGLAGATGGPTFLSTAGRSSSASTIRWAATRRARRSPAPRSRSTTAGPTSAGSNAPAQKRASIARGQDIFNNHPIRIAGVARAQRQARHRHASTAPAPPATTRPTSATTRWRCRSTSA